MSLFTLAEISQCTDPTLAEIHAQMTQRLKKTTKTGKPYLEITLSDGSGNIHLKIWDNKPWYPTLNSLPEKAFLSITAEWLKGEFGVEANQLDIRPLSDHEIQSLLGASNNTRVESDWEDIECLIASMKDPRLKAVCFYFITKQKSRILRAGAARNYHHARRGGLVEHVASMMRSASALCTVYKELNRDLLMAGAIFHDCGKLWESCFNAQDFDMPYDDLGEMLGHIPLGIEFVNKLFNIILSSEDGQKWNELTPSNADVRLHLLHIIASHHGELAFGSPVVPKTPEAIALHYIDNLDAKLEMFRATYDKEEMLNEKVYKRNPPLPGNVFKPLDHYK